MQNSPFVDIKTTVNYAKGHLIQWWLSPAFTGKPPFEFEVRAYQDPVSVEPLWVRNVGDSFFAIDDSRIRQNHQDDLAYRVTLIDADGKRYESHPITLLDVKLTRHQYLIASEMSRKEWVRMRYVGQFGWLLKRKMYTTPLQDEHDPVTGEPIVDTTKGFGVGHSDGYYKPMIFKYSLESFEQNTDYHPEGRGPTYQEHIAIRSVGYPYLTSHDIVVNSEGKRYILDNVTGMYYPGSVFLVTQKVTGHLLPNTDTVYSIEVPEFPDSDNA